MGTEEPNGNGSTSRAGTRALALLATPISGMIVRSLADGPKQLIDLRKDCGSPAQTTLRAHVKALEELHVVERRRGGTFPGAIEFDLTPAGREMLLVVATVQQWLERGPDGPLDFGGPRAKASIKVLIEAWSSTIMRALGARPLSPTQLDSVITGLSYPALERRLGALKAAGLIRSCEGHGKVTPYAPSAWLREGVAPLCAAALWERRHLGGRTSPVGQIDVEAAFLLTLPLLRLPTDLSGCCRLGVEMRSNDNRWLVGTMARVEDGRVPSYTVRLESSADAWATGSTRAWLEAVVGLDGDGVELGGDQRLARALLEGLHRTLFGARIAGATQEG